MVDILPLKMLQDRVPNPDSLVYWMFITTPTMAAG